MKWSGGILNRWFKRCWCLWVFLSAQGSVSGKNYVVGVENLNMLPYYGFEATDKEFKNFMGLIKDVLEAYEAKSGHHFIYRAYPNHRLFKEYLKGSMDFKFPSNPEWRMEQKKSSGLDFYYTQALLPFMDGLIVRKDKKGQALGGALKKLEVVRGWTPWLVIDLVNNGTLKKSESHDVVSGLKKVSSGRSDIALGNIGHFHYLRSQHENGLGQDLVWDQSLTHKLAAYHMGSLEHPEVLKDLDKFVETSGDLLTQLRDKWGVKKELWGMPVGTETTKETPKK